MQFCDYSFHLPPCTARMYLGRNPSKKGGEKTDSVSCYNTFAGQGRNIYEAYKGYGFMSREIFPSWCVCVKPMHSLCTAVRWITTSEIQSAKTFWSGTCTLIAGINPFTWERRFLYSLSPWEQLWGYRILSLMRNRIKATESNTTLLC